MPKLIIQSQGQEWAQDLAPGSNVVGRSSQCSVPIKDPSLSRQHCEIVLSGASARLVDKGSMNGTLLNGKRVQEQALQPGDRITIGSVHLWLDHKGNLPSEKKELPRAQVVPEAAPNAPTRRAVTVEPEPAAPVAPRAGVQEAAAAYLADYAYRGRAGLPVGRIVAAVVALAVLGGLAYAGRGLLGGPATTTRQDDNLIRDGSFAAASSRPDGWAARALNGSGGADKAGGALSIEPAQGRGGGPCLVLEKPGTAADSSVEVAWTADLPLSGAVEASAQVRFEGFSGHAAFKIDWLRARGAVALEACSKPVTRCSDWTQVGGRFVPPVGATGFRAALAFVGRGGRVYVDDVRLLPGSAETAPALALGEHRVHFADSAVFQFDVRGRRPLMDVGLRLESEKEGSVWQAFGDRVKVEPKDRKLVWRGRFLHPADYREIEYDGSLEPGDEYHTGVYYKFAADALRQVDRVTIAFTLPRCTLLGADAAKPVTRLVASAPEGDLSVEFLVPARVRVVQAGGLPRVLATFRVDPAADPAEFGLDISDAGAGKDPEARAEQLMKAGRFGEALVAYREVKHKDPQRQQEVQTKIARLQKEERDAWVDVQSRHFKAWISRRPETVEDARKNLDAYEQKWARGASPAEYTSKAAELREEDRKQGAAGADREAERPGQLLSLAKKYAEAGLKSLAQAAIQALVDRYPQSEAAAQGLELRKTLGM